MFTITLLVVNTKGEQHLDLSSADFGGNKKKIGGTTRGSPPLEGQFAMTTYDCEVIEFFRLFISRIVFVGAKIVFIPTYKVGNFS